MLTVPRGDQQRDIKHEVRYEPCALNVNISAERFYQWVAGRNQFRGIEQVALFYL